MEKISYVPKGVCSRRIDVEVDHDIIKRVEFMGGCPGNTVGVARLCVGKKIDEVVEILSGIDCRGRGTSCPDQLAKALEKVSIKISNGGKNL